MNRKPRTFPVSFRVTAEQLETLDRLAQEAGLSRPDFLRAAALGARPRRDRKGPAGMGDLKKAHNDLNTLGRNLNATLRLAQALAAELGKVRPADPAGRVREWTAAFGKHLEAYSPLFMEDVRRAVLALTKAADRIEAGDR